MRWVSLGRGSRRRRAVGAAPAGLLVVAMLAVASVVTAPAAAVAAAARPHISSMHVSRHVLASHGGRVKVRVTTRAANRCRLSVHPAVRVLPVKDCSDGRAGWTVRLPRNKTAVAAKYRLRLVAAAHGRRDTAERRVTVAETADPPSVGKVTLSRIHTPYFGGAVKVTAPVRRSRTCLVRVSPTVPNPPPVKDCTTGSPRWTVHLPENPSTTAPVDYTLTVMARGSHHQTATRDAATTVTVGPHPPPCPGQTSTADPVTAAYFNDPTTRATADQNRVVDAEINLICAAHYSTQREPTRIDLAVFVFELQPVTDALVWARRYMHADVHVALDGSNNVMQGTDGTTVANPAYESLAAALPRGAVVLCGPNAFHAPPASAHSDDATVFPAGTGCAGDNILHTKLLTVSAVGADREPAVFTSSQNLSLNSEQAAFNDGLQIVGDQQLYAEDVAYFGMLEDNQRAPDLGASLPARAHQAGSATTTATYFPQNSPAQFPSDNGYHASNDGPTDRVAKLLRTIDCANPGSQAGVSTPGGRRTTVRIAMFSYGKRDKVTAALTRLGEAGCDVSLLYSRITKNAQAALTAAGVQTAQLDVAQFQYPDGSGSGRVFIHDKFIAVSGGLVAHGATQTNQTLVLMGSANFTQKGLHRNDEANVEYQQAATAPGGPAIYDAYLADWQHLAEVAATAPPA